MHTIDFIIISIIAIIVILIFYFSIWKNRKNPCHDCPYFKNCNTNSCNNKTKNK